MVREPVPAHDARGDLLARVADAPDRAAAIDDEAELAAQHRARNLVIQLFADAVHDKHSRIGHRLRRNHLLVRLGPFRLLRAAGTRASAAAPRAVLACDGRGRLPGRS